MKKLLVLFILIPIVNYAQYIQLGSDINGQQANEGSFSVCELNADGNVLAIGLQNNSDVATASGQVRVFELNANNWVLKGNVINGNNDGEVLGASIDINASGNVIAIGAPSSSTISNYASVYEFDGTDWSQLGADFIGLNQGDSYGTGVSINAQGTVVAISAEPFFTNSYIQIFEWDGSNWTQLGSDIIGTAPEDGFGRSISLNADGTSLAVGAPNVDGNGNALGIVRIYEYNGTDWVQKGNDIFGDSSQDQFGNGVTINNDGTIVAAGADEALNGFIGYAKVIEWNGSNWVQKGNNITTPINANFFATDNRLNDTGDILISGSLDGNFATVNQFDGTNWVVLDNIISNNSGEQFGSSVSINSSGSIVSIGAQGSDVGGMQSGQFKAFENTALSTTNFIDANQLFFYPNPVQNFIYVESKTSIKTYKIISLDGRTVLQNNVNIGNKLKIDLTVVPSGVYFLKIEFNKSSETFKIIKK